MVKKTKKQAFTIVELVIVIAVIAILAAIIIPTYSNLVKKANEATALVDAKNMITEMLADILSGDKDAADIIVFSKKGDSIFVYGYDADAGRVLTYHGHPIKAEGNFADQVGDGTEITKNATKSTLLAQMLNKDEITPRNPQPAEGEWNNPEVLNNPGGTVEGLGFDRSTMAVFANYDIVPESFAKKDSGGEEGHVHDWATTWSYDGAYHWKTCSGCTEILEQATHTLVYDHDDTQHWQKCSVCEYETEKTAHDGNNPCVCGYSATTPAHTHSWGDPTYTWTQDGETYKCTATHTCSADGCDLADKTETEIITATSATTKAATCSAEGEKTYTATFTKSGFTMQTKTVSIPTAEHSFGNDWYKDPTYHWKECSVCGEKAEISTHEFVNGQCKCGATNDTVYNVSPTDTISLIVGKKVKIKYSDARDYWSPVPSTSQGFSETDYLGKTEFATAYIKVTDIDVENNTATIEAIAAGTQTVYVCTKTTAIEGGTVSSSTQFTVSVIKTSGTDTVDPEKYDYSILGYDSTINQLVFGQYSKYAEDMKDAVATCIMDQAGSGSIKAYKVVKDGKNILYILSNSATQHAPSNVSSLTSKFTNVEIIDLGNLAFGNSTEKKNFKNMFSSNYGSSKLTTIYVTQEQVDYMQSIDLSSIKMFSDAEKLVGGSGTVYSEHGSTPGSYSGTKGGYAVIDEGTSNPGYFTNRTSSPFYKD